MRGLLRTVAATIAAAAVGITAACGVVADDRAAVVHDITIPTAGVDQLTRDATFIRSVIGGESPPDTQSTLPGDTARSVLLFEIQRAALLHEAERWGVEVGDAARAEARQQVRRQIASERRVTRPVLDRLAEFLAARNAMDERFSELDPDSEQDLRAFYDGAPALWDRTCVVVVQVGAGSVDRAERLVRQGATPREIADRVEESQLVADPEQSCLPLEQLPTELAASVAEAEVGRVVGPVVEADGTGFVYRVTGTESLSFADARDELSALAESLGQQGVGPWIGLTLLDGVWVNPRYGSGVVVGPTGELQVAPPQAPPVIEAGLPELLAP
jgi:hypothetical protein